MAVVALAGSSLASDGPARTGLQAQGLLPQARIDVKDRSVHAMECARGRPPHGFAPMSGCGRTTRAIPKRIGPSVAIKLSDQALYLSMRVWVPRRNNDPRKVNVEGAQMGDDGTDWVFSIPRSARRIAYLDVKASYNQERTDYSFWEFPAQGEWRR